MEIVTSRVSVYEIELDLQKWDVADSAAVPGFYNALDEAIPSISEHKCMSGQAGGFLAELRKGTNFAHVIEHVLLEMIHLADPERQVYTGWTRDTGDMTYIIHYSAPDFLTGRLAAILGVDLVKRLIQGEKVALDHYISLLKDPSSYFSQDEPEAGGLIGGREPTSVIQEFQESPTPETTVAETTLTDHQRANICDILTHTSKHMNYIVEMWRRSFIEYAGNFGKAIIDKIELANMDKFLGLLLSNKFESFFRGIKNASHVIGTYRIPLHFPVHSIWLYKNHLLAFVIEEYKDRSDFLHQAIQDFEDFFQVVLYNVSKGYAMEEPAGGMPHLSELTEFRELRKRSGLILAVDDDEITRRAFRDLLEYHGHHVIMAEGGAQALQILYEKGDEISLVILDLFMPGMDGMEAYRRIKELKPALKILVSSGYPIDDKTGKLLSAEMVHFISKPFKVEEFLSLVESMLGSEPALNQTGRTGLPRQ